MTTANQEAVNWINTQQAYIVRLEKSEQRQVINVLEKMEKDLVATIRKSEVTEAVRDITKIKRQKELLKQSNIIIDDYYKDILVDQKAELTRLSQIQSASTAKGINTLFGVDLAIKLDTKTARIVATESIFGNQNAKANITQWWSGQGAGFKTKYRNAMQTGILANDSMSDMVIRLRGSRALGYSDGIMNTSYRNAKTLVRTSVINIANESRMQTYQENNDLVKGFTWSSALDNRTTPICQALDGLSWDLDYNPIDHSYEYPGSTAHFGCRSTQVPLLKSWEELAGKKKTIIEEEIGTRSARDLETGLTGKVPKSTSYNTWLKDQTKENQNDILGVEKAKLFRSGKYTVRDFVNDDGIPLTLDEIANKNKV